MRGALFAWGSGVYNAVELNGRAIQSESRIAGGGVRGTRGEGVRAAALARLWCCCLVAAVAPLPLAVAGGGVNGGLWCGARAVVVLAGARGGCAEARVRGRVGRVRGARRTWCARWGDEAVEEWRARHLRPALLGGRCGP